MHKTVFLSEAVDLLCLKEGDIVIDATFGEGGHSRRIFEQIGSLGKVFAFDRDPDAIAKAKQMVKEFSNLIPVHKNFSDMEAVLEEYGIDKVAAVLFDFGLSQGQIEESGRGFSFRTDEPLDMRMNPEDKLTAHLIVNSYPEETIRNIIQEFGEDYRARRIARAIKAQRERKPIETTRELADLVMRLAKPQERRGRIHPATKTFQALRIAVNNELGSIQEGLQKAVHFLAEKGRLVAISFHSLEDRIVKRYFREQAQMGSLRVITKKPLEVSALELATNPRARSAKIRVAERLSTQNS